MLQKSSKPPANCKAQWSVYDSREIPYLVGLYVVSAKHAKPCSGISRSFYFNVRVVQNVKAYMKAT